MSQMGRPKIDNPKATQITVRMDAETLKRLDFCAEHYGVKRVDVIRAGIDKLFSDIKK